LARLEQIRNWVQATAIAMGGPGIFLVAFLDSSVLTFPVINDLLVIQLSILNPARMPYYALMATLGSVAGCVLLYFLARKGGEIVFRRRAGARAEGIRRWLDRNGFLGVLVAALLPPPTPFKVFILGAGVFGVPLRTFTLALLLARSLRYFGEGFLAVRYGAWAIQYLTAHRLRFTLIVLGAVLSSYLLGRLWARRLDLHP